MSLTSYKAFFYILKNRNNITTTKLQEHFKFDKSKLLQVKRELSDNRLVMFKNDNIVLTEYGKSYVLKQFLRVLKIIVFSVIVPIVVAVISAKITMNSDNCCNNTNQNSNYSSNNK